MSIKYQVHAQDIGWMDVVTDGAIAGTVGQARQLEAYRILDVGVPGLGVHAFAHVENCGWSAGNIMNEDVGSTGLGLHIEAIKIGLIGEQAPNYDIWYRCHVADFGWLNWSSNGAENGTIGGNKQIEAIQIELHHKSEGFNPTVNRIENYINLTPQNPPQPQAPNILDIARSHVGYISGTSEDSAFGRRLVGPMAGDWCCYYCVCCAIDAGLNVPITGYVPTMYQWGLDTGRFTYDPQPEDFILFDFNGNGTPDHIGIVKQVISSDHCITYEGNTDQGRGIGVYEVDRDWGILGYIRLN